MKPTFYSWVLTLLGVGLLLGCTSGNYNSKTGKDIKDYSQYNNMVEVMQSVRGLRVMGSGANARVFMSGYNTVNATNREPLFVIDGAAIGNSLAQVNRLITPVQVRSVDTVRGMQATSRYGDQAMFGVVLIKTINADKSK